MPRAAALPTKRRRISSAAPTSPRLKARARAIASRGRVSAGASASKIARTRSAQSAAQDATVRRSASVSVCGERIPSLCSWRWRVGNRRYRSASGFTANASIGAAMLRTAGARSRQAGGRVRRGDRAAESRAGMLHSSTSCTDRALGVEKGPARTIQSTGGAASFSRRART